MRKQLLLVLLALMPFLASAEEVEIDGIYYNLVSKIKEAEVISNPNEYRGNIVIPAIVEYEGVTYSVTSIGDGAFKDCLSLYSIETGDGVKKITQNAFYKCRSLQSIGIGRKVESIEYNSFYMCDRLSKVLISDLSSWLNLSGGNHWPCAHHLYLNGEEILEINIPDSISVINPFVFNQCAYITSIKLHNNVTTIGSGAFAHCEGLSEFTIPNSVTTIENNAFNGCTGLTSMIIPNSVTAAGSGLFANCTSLESISIPQHVTDISGWFQNCTNLVSVNIPSNLETIGHYTFQNCKSLTSIVIPNNVTQILLKVFDGCTSLTTVIVGNKISVIRDKAFSTCSNLTDFYCYSESVPSTPSSAFDNSYIEYATLHVPEIAYESYRTTEPWSNFGTIKVIDGETPIVEKCATPTITYSNGKVKFACETEGVEFVPSIMVTPNQLQNGNELAIGGTFTVNVYAVKEGYDNSDTATMTINMSQMGDVNADGELNAADITAVVNAILGK